MLATIDERCADISVTFETQWVIRLEPGMWITDYRGDTVSVTTIYGRHLDGRIIHIGYPRGVIRKAGGTWSVQERILVDVLPDEPDKAWAALPASLRSALEDAYLLRWHDLSEELAAT